MTTRAHLSEVAAELRLKNLLAWAVDFVAHETQVMRDSFTDKDGNYDPDDEDMHLEVQDAERWLTEAREAIK